MGLFTIPREEFDACIRELQTMNDTSEGWDDFDAESVLSAIEPTILKLRSGKALFAQVEKLVRANNPQRAVKLLNAAGPTRGMNKRFISLFGTPVILAAVFFVGVPIMPRLDASYELAQTALKSCPEATTLLGPNVGQSPVGLAWGSSESGGGYGRASWSIPVQGDQRSGRYQYGARNTGQGWQLDFARLEVGAQKIDVASCAAGAGGVAPIANALTAAVSLSGVVTAAQGKATVPLNTPCTITVSPSEPQFAQRGYNCHVRVQCGTAIIYGWEGAGITKCHAVNGQAATAYDPDGATKGDDPILSLDRANRVCTVADDGANAFNVTISLTQ